MAGPEGWPAQGCGPHREGACFYSSPGIAGKGGHIGPPLQGGLPIEGWGLGESPLRHGKAVTPLPEGEARGPRKIIDFVGRGGRNGAGAVLAVRRGRSRAEFLPTKWGVHCTSPQRAVDLPARQGDSRPPPRLGRLQAPRPSGRVKPPPYGGEKSPRPPGPKTPPPFRGEIKKPPD